MSDQRRYVVVRHRDIVNQKPVAADRAEQRQDATRILDADRARQDRWIGRHPDEATFGQGAGGPASGTVRRKPLARRGVVNVRIPCQRNKCVDIEKAHGTSALFECAAHDLRGDWRRTRGHPDHWEIALRFDTRRREAAPSEFRYHRAKRPALPSRELTRRSNHVVVDVKGRAHPV